MACFITERGELKAGIRRKFRMPANLSRAVFETTVRSVGFVEVPLARLPCAGEHRAAWPVPPAQPHEAASR